MFSKSLIAVALSAISQVHAADSIPEIQRFYSFSPTLAISGQPKRGQFAALAKGGYKVVINVASPDSNPDAFRDEKQLVEAAGMAYYFIPLSWETPDVNQVASAVKLLKQLEGQSTLVHCYIGSRASLVAYLYRITYANAPEKDEKLTLERLWNLNRGYEFQNSAQWQFALDDAQALLKK